MRAVFAELAVVALIVGCTNQTLTPTETATPTSLAKDADQTQESKAPSEPLGVGDPAPTFEGLEGTDDKRHSLKDYADAKAVVIAFICNHCPVAVAYEDRLIALQKDYADKGVKVVAINVNNLEQDKLPAMKERAEEEDFPFAYLYDPSQKVGRDFGAAVTPHVFLLDGKMRLAFVGPVDDNQDESKVTKQYVRDAVDAILAGKTPETTDVTPFGCSIKYE